MPDITVSADIHSFMQAANAAAARVVLSSAALAANTFTALQTITQASANAGILASTGYSLTGSNATSMVDLAGTWNTSGTPTGIKLAITNTASNASSKFFDFLGGASGTTDLCYLRVDGALRILKGYSATNYHIGDASGGISWSGGGSFFTIGGIAKAAITATDGLIVSSALGIGFTSGNADAAVNDAFFMRKAAATIQMGADANGVTNQSLTAASRITSDGVGANLTISAGNGRGGAGGSLIFSTYDTQGAGTIGNLQTRMTIDTTGLTTFSGATMIDGSADAVQLTVQGHSTQTSNVFLIEKSDGTDLLTVSNTGVVTLVQTLNTSGNLNISSTWGVAAATGNQTMFYTATFGWASGSGGAGVAVDALFARKAAATIQMGADANGVTNQHFTAASRITSDGVGANLTISGGNGRGGAGGSLIFSTYTTAGAATIGTLTTRLTLDTAGLLTFADAVDMAFNATTGTKIGTATGQKIGFWNATPVVQQVLATGGGATVDNVISLLQTLGLCKQS